MPSSLRSTKTSAGTAPGLPEAVWFELCGDGSFVQHRVVSLFGFGWRHVPDGLEQPLVVEPVDPFQCRVFDGFEGSPRPPLMDDLGLVEAVDGLGQGVVIAVAHTADTARCRPR